MFLGTGYTSIKFTFESRIIHPHHYEKLTKGPTPRLTRGLIRRLKNNAIDRATTEGQSKGGDIEFSIEVEKEFLLNSCGKAVRTEKGNLTRVCNDSAL